MPATPADRGQRAKEVGPILRTFCLTAVAVTVLLAGVVSSASAKTPAGLAAGGSPSDRFVRSSLARLQGDVSRTPSRVLPARQRRRVLRRIGRAAALFNKGRVCTTLRTVDQLRQILRPRGATRADLDVVRIDRLLLRFRETRSCVKATKTAALPRAPGGQWVPRPGGDAEIEQGEISARLPRGRFRPVRHRSPEVRTFESQIPLECGEQCPPPSAFATDLSDPIKRFRDDEIGDPVAALNLTTEHWPAEVQAASAKGVVWATGNEAAAYSIDGAKFQFVDPRALFNDNSDGGADGDMVVRYAPQINRFIWLIQYRCAPIDCSAPGVKHNRYRLATASPEAIRKDPRMAWKQKGPWDMTAALMKQKDRWFDFPAAEVSGTTTPSSSLYLTWTVMDGPAEASVVGRINLAGLLSGSPVIQWYVDNNSRVRPAQGTRGRAFFVRHVNDSKLRIWSWDESSKLAFTTDVDHATIPTFDWQSLTPAPASFDWIQVRSVRWEPLGVTVRNNELWAAWGAGRRYKPGGSLIFAQPHIEIVVFNATTLKKISERQVGNNDEAYFYPSLATNSEGDVALGFSYGGGGIRSASPAVGLLTGKQQLWRVDNNDPTGGQGDYTGVQVDYPNTARFSEGSFIKKASDGKDHWLYTVFGRGK